MFNLSKAGKITRVMNAVAAGITSQNSSSVDMLGFDGVMFIALFGALTATQVTSIKAQQSSDDGSTDAYDDLIGTLVGPLADADGNKILVLDIQRPQKRYVRCVVNRATANAVIDGVLAVQYRAAKMPTTQPTSVASIETHLSPAEGTA
jgi:hypothetical protein